MKILIITGCVYAENCNRKSFTGLDYVVSDISRTIASKCDITIFTTTPYPKSSKLGDIPIKSYSYMQLLNYMDKKEILKIIKKKNVSIREKMKLIRASALSYFLSNLCKKEKFDLISMQGAGHCNIMLSRVAQQNNIPIVYTLHGLLSFGAPNIDYIDKVAEIELLKYIKKHGDVLTVVSEGVKKQISEKYGISSEKVHVINNAVKTSCVVSDRIIEQNKEKNDFVNIVSVGTLCENKNQIQLVRAYNLLPENIKKKCRVYLVGKDDSNGIIKKYIIDNKLTDSVKICGFLKKKDVERLYLNASFNVLLSISEGFGMSMIEAAYFGVPTLTFNDLDAAHDIYSEDSMILVNDRSDKAVCEGLIKMINRKWDSKKIRKSVDKFNENTYFQYLKIFENIYKEKMNFIEKDFTGEFVVKI